MASPKISQYNFALSIGKIPKSHIDGLNPWSAACILVGQLYLMPIDFKMKSNMVSEQALTWDLAFICPNIINVISPFSWKNYSSSTCKSWHIIESRSEIRHWSETTSCLSSRPLHDHVTMINGACYCGAFQCSRNVFHFKLLWMNCIKSVCIPMLQVSTLQSC